MTKELDRLRALVQPGATAVLTMELQRGVVGPEALLPDLADEVARAGTVTNAARVCRTARSVGAAVLHCTAVTRPDGAGAAINNRILALGDKMRRQQGFAPNEIGRDGAAVMPELGPEPTDLEVARLHGLTPFTSTALDQILRNLGVTTIVATGVSVNIGVLGMCLSAVDLGYQVVLVRDAVAGVPAAYADAVIDNTLALLTTLTTTDELCSLWDGMTGPG